MYIIFVILGLILAFLIKVLYLLPIIYVCLQIRNFGMEMAKIKVKNLQVGMTLITDVCDPNGRFLLGNGCELNEKHLKALNAWGVISVEINDDDMPVNEDRIKISPEIYKAIENKVKSRFQHNDMNISFIEELAAESTQFFVERLEE